MSDPSQSYALLDCGYGRKLERFGPHVLDRPVNYAVWPPATRPKHWPGVAAKYHRSDKGGGEWEAKDGHPESWEATWSGIRFKIKPTPFGHVGLFPEQATNWGWLRERCETLEDDAEVLNLFAYTGGSTLACAQGGVKVCHVDSSKGVVGWARENAALNGLKDRPVRWIVDDVIGFVEREGRRGRIYRGMIMDPPSYGRGAKGQVFKIEEDLIRLVNACWDLMGDGADFFLLSCHSGGFTPRVLGQILARSAPAPGRVDTGEMVVPGTEGGPELPSGVYARWMAGA